MALVYLKLVEFVDSLLYRNVFHLRMDLVSVYSVEFI